VREVVKDDEPSAYEVSDETKFDQYQLPGGENYREVLLQMPVPNAPSRWTTRANEEETDYAGEEMRDLVDVNGIVRMTGTPQEIAQYLREENQLAPEGRGDKKKVFKSSHYDELNIFAHVRLNDRTGPNGEKVLFVEEIQSDWAREARELGVEERRLPPLPDTLEVVKIGPTNWAVRRKSDARTIMTGKTREDAIREWQEFNKVRGVPDFPFRKNWHEFALKRVLRMAAEEGYDQVAWITGEQTADRYDLSKQLSKVRVQKTMGGDYQVTAWDKDGAEVISQGADNADELAGMVGKDLANTAISDLEESREKTYSGLDLKIGGEWAANLYDRMIPKFLNKYGKKWGVKVGPVTLGEPEAEYKVNRNSRVKPEDGQYELTKRDSVEILSRHKTAEEAWASAEALSQSKHPSLPITPEMRESVLEGQPMFQRSEDKSERAKKAVQGAKKKGVVPSKKKVADLPPEPPEGGIPTVSDDAPEIAGLVKPETKGEMFRRKAQDKFNRLSVVQRQISKGLNEEIPQEMDAYLQQEIVHGKVEHQMGEFERKHIDPLIRAIKNSGLTMEQVEDYLYARHAAERNAHVDKIRPDFAEQGIPGSGMSNEEAQAILDAAKKSGKEQKLFGIAVRVRAINEQARNILEEAGLISPEERAAWEGYRFYVPLKGVGEAQKADVARARIGRGFDIRGAESKRALGRKSKASNILSNTVLQMNQAIARAEKNKVSQAFLKFVQAHPDKNLWEIDEVKYEPRFDKKTGEVVYRPDPRYQLADNVLAVKVGGKQHHITIKDGALAAAMKNLGAEKTGKALQLMGAFNRYMSMIHTQLNPDFALANFSRDIQTAIVNTMGEEVSTKEAMSRSKDIVKGIPFAIRAVASANGLKVPGLTFPRGMTQQKFNEYYREFEKAGGRVGFFGLKNLNQIQNDLVKRLSELQPGNRQKARMMFRKVKDLVLAANDSVENATRLSTYIALRERGVSTAKAASAAKNITVNFNKKGELGTAMNALWVFSNAGVQGSARLFRALKNPRVKKIAAGIIVGSASMALLNRHLAGEDDDDGENYYDKIPMWVKENNLVLMKPGGKGDHFKIPVPYGYNVFWAVGQAFDKVVHNPETAVQSAGELAGAVVNSFNPMGGELGFSSKRIVQALSPTFSRPVVDIAINEDFMGAPIYKEEKYGPPKAKSHQFFKSTSEVSKTVAQGLNEITGGHAYKPGWADVSPDVFDYVGEYLVGGLGKTINRSASSIAKATTGQEVSVREIPVVRRFIGEISDQQDVNNFYDNIEKAQQARANYKYLLATDKNAAKKFMSENKRFLWLTTEREMEVYNKDGTSQTRRTTQVNAWLRDFKALRDQRKKFDMLGNKEKVKIIDEKITKMSKRINKLIKSRM